MWTYVTYWSDSNGHIIVCATIQHTQESLGWEFRWSHSVVLQLPWRWGPSPAFVWLGGAVWRVRARVLCKRPYAQLCSFCRVVRLTSAAVSGPVLFLDAGLRVLVASRASRPWGSPIRPLTILHTITHGFDVSISHIGGPGDLGNVSHYVFSGLPSRVINQFPGYIIMYISHALRPLQLGTISEII